MCLLVHHKFPASSVSTSHPSLHAGMWPLAMPTPFLHLAQLLFHMRLCNILPDSGSCLVCPYSSLTRQHRAAARAHRDLPTSSSEEWNGAAHGSQWHSHRPSVWPWEGRALHPASQGHSRWWQGWMPSVVGTPWLRKPWQFLWGKLMCSQGKNCSLHVVCVNLEYGHPLEVSCWAQGVCKQPRETVRALTFLCCSSNFFFWHYPVFYQT